MSDRLLGDLLSKKEKENMPLPGTICSMDSFYKNVEYMKDKHSGPPTDVDLAASYTALRKDCGIPKDSPRMTPSQIIGKSKAK